MLNDTSLAGELECYRCGKILDIEDSICDNCGALLREDSILL